MDTTAITTRHNETAHSYELLDDGRVIGAARYLPFDDESGPQRIFFHTDVDKEYGGQGLAGRLATLALNDAVAAGTAIVPVCPFIRAFLGRHREYAPNAVEVAPHHLEAVSRR